MEKQHIVDELENLLTSHEMMLIKVGSLKIKDKEEAMFSKDSKSKLHHKHEGNSQAGGETKKGRRPRAMEVQSCYKSEKSRQIAQDCKVKMVVLERNIPLWKTQDKGRPLSK